MPGYVTHYCFGVQAYKELAASELKDILTHYHKVYALGLQGADPFMYHIPTMAGMFPKYASMIHQCKTKLFFSNLINACKRLNNQYEYRIASAYIQGFLGHYYLDSRLHPYVYARVGNAKDSYTGGCHIGCETDIDREILLRNKGLSMEEFDHRKPINISAREKKIVSQILSYAIEKTYSVKASEAYINAVISTFIAECGYLMDKHRLKHQTLFWLEKHTIGHAYFSPLLINNITHIDDPCNGRHQTWTNPWNPSQTISLSVYELMETAREEYLQSMQALQKGLKVAYQNPSRENDALQQALASIGNQSYLTGMESES